MKKLTLLLSTLGGAMAGYVSTNKKLRDELSKSKDAESAAKILGKHLQKDGKTLAKQVREFVDSDEVQQNLTKVKKYASAKAKEAKKELDTMMKKGVKTAKATAKKNAPKAKKAVKKTATAAKKKVATVAKKTKTAAKKKTA